MAQGRRPRNPNPAGENLPVADRLLTVGQVADNWQVSQRTAPHDRRRATHCRAPWPSGSHLGEGGGALNRSSVRTY